MDAHGIEKILIHTAKSTSLDTIPAINNGFVVYFCAVLSFSQFITCPLFKLKHL